MASAGFVVCRANLEGGWCRGDWILKSRTLFLSDSAACIGISDFLLGTAFSFVHWLDDLAATKTRLRLPAGSRIMETGGYKGRSRAVAKTELRGLLTKYIERPG